MPKKQVELRIVEENFVDWLKVFRNLAELDFCFPLIKKNNILLAAINCI